MSLTFSSYLKLDQLLDLQVPETDELDHDEMLFMVIHQVCERMMDLDEGQQEWRYRHVKMVERTIGSKPGTGGSPGAADLKTTLFKPIFPDLWAIRASL